MDDSPITWYVAVSREASKERFSSPPLLQLANQLRNPPRDWRYVITYNDRGNIGRILGGWHRTEQEARAEGEAQALALFAPEPARPSQAQTQQAPPPSENMPAEIRALYEDARRVIESRSANALLRVACEDLCRIKGIPRGRDGFYGTIQNLREREGTSITLTDALDAIRITGNDAVHGNETDYDIPLEKLFNLVNIIVDEWRKADEVASVYEALPDDKKVPRPPDHAR